MYLSSIYDVKQSFRIKKSIQKTFDLKLPSLSAGGKQKTLVRKRATFHTLKRMEKCIFSKCIYPRRPESSRQRFVWVLMSVYAREFDIEVE